MHGVEFVHAETTKLDLAARKVETTAGAFGYDYLVIATGYRNDFDAVEGLGPAGNAYTITTPPDAERAGRGWRRFLDRPSDIYRPNKWPMAPQRTSSPRSRATPPALPTRDVRP
jgi:sulfide:quinone oxidoreductase